MSLKTFIGGDVQLADILHTYTRDKDGKKKKRDGDEEGSNEGSADADDDEDDEGEVVWMTDTSEEAAKARAQEQLTAAMASIVTQVCAVSDTFLHLWLAQQSGMTVQLYHLFCILKVLPRACERGESVCCVWVLIGPGNYGEMLTLIGAKYCTGQH